jgi:hypothetical protein
MTKRATAAAPVALPSSTVPACAPAGPTAAASVTASDQAPSLAALTATAQAALEEIMPPPSFDTPSAQSDRTPTPDNWATRTPVDYSWYNHETGIYYPGSAPTPRAHPNTPNGGHPWSPLTQPGSSTPRASAENIPPVGSTAFVNWALDQRIKRLEEETEDIPNRRTRAKFIRSSIYDEVHEILHEKLENSVSLGFPLPNSAGSSD